MARQLDGRVMVVTGGTRGIGRAIVLRAVAHGARVAFCARTLGPAAIELQTEATRLGGEVLPLQADVAQESEVQALFDTVVARFGQVDVVVNNAGISIPGLLVSFATADLETLIAVNLTGSFLIAREALKHFVRRGRGQLITIGSLSQYGMQADAAYAMSKAGLWGLTQAIAAEYGPAGIQANLVTAGYIDTDMVAQMPPRLQEALIQQAAQKRPGHPDEVAGAVLFLASEPGRGINGQVLAVAGGLGEIPLY